MFICSKVYQSIPFYPPWHTGFTRRPALPTGKRKGPELAPWPNPFGSVSFLRSPIFWNSVLGPERGLNFFRKLLAGQNHLRHCSLEGLRLGFGHASPAPAGLADHVVSGKLSRLVMALAILGGVGVGSFCTLGQINVETVESEKVRVEVLSASGGLSNPGPGVVKVRELRHLQLDRIGLVSSTGLVGHRSVRHRFFLPMLGSVRVGSIPPQVYPI